MRPAILLWASSIALAVAVGANGEIFSDGRVPLLSSDAAKCREPELPIASAEDQARFDMDYGAALREARNGKRQDSASAAELFARKGGQQELKPGVRRLLLVHSVELGLAGGAPDGEMLGFANEAMAALDQFSVPYYQSRIKILEGMHRRFGNKVPQFSARAAAEQYFALAEIELNRARHERATEAFTAGKKLALEDGDFLAQKKVGMEAFEDVIRKLADVGATLAKDPGDKRANTLMGLFLLGRGVQAQDAAPYLQRSDQAKLKGLGEALLAPRSVANRLRTAGAAMSALEGAAPEIQRVLGEIVAANADAVLKDAQASEAQKVQAELAQIKVGKVLGNAATMPSGEIAKFFRVETPARRIVYIADSSGSMLDNFDFLKLELSRSIGMLGEGQSANVILVSDKAAAMAPQMLPASEANKKLLLNALRNAMAESANDDLLEPFQQAFERAIAMKPDVIYFLTDGKFSERLPAVVKKLNALKKTKIFTIAFVTEEPSYKEGLQLLAGENGGSYRFVPEKELGK